MAEITEKDVKSIDTYSVKCKSCGGTMVFNPEKQTLYCEHCGNEIDVQKDFDVKENDIKEGFAHAEMWDADEQATYRCGNCGAVVVVNRDEQASLCPFCGTSHIVKEGSFKGLKPQVVIPFQFGADRAGEFSKKWARRRLFAPRKFKKSLSPENMHGVYEPCFTFDSNTVSYYEGRVGERRTRTVGSGDNKRTETYTVYYRIKGTIEHFFDDIFIATNANFAQEKFWKIQPFDTKKSCVYENKYLSGFVADRYQRDIKDCWEDAKKSMDKRIREFIRDRHNYDVVDYINVRTTHNDVKYKYVLVPVYMMNYRYKNKSYDVYVNGSTGKVGGKTPVSPLRIAIAVLLGAAAVVGLALLFLHSGFLD